jgi:hypothetical protein
MGSFHLRDFRSLFMLKLARLDRAGLDPQALLDAQRDRLAVILAALEAKAKTSSGFDMAPARWRLESARAAMRFLESVSDSGARSETDPRDAGIPRSG